MALTAAVDTGQLALAGIRGIERWFSGRVWRLPS